MEPLHIQREGLPDLIERNPQTFGFVLVDVQQTHGVDHIQPVLAGCRDADLGPALAPDALVHLVGMRERLGREALVVDHPRFLQMRRVVQPDAEAAVRHVEVRDHQLHPVRIAVNHAGGLHGVLHGLETDPKAREPAQRPAVDAIVEDFLHTGRGDHGHIGIDHGPFGLVQHGGGFAGVVVAHGHQHATMGRGARHVGMAHHVAGAVHARPLAVPQREHAVMLALAAQFGLLAAPDCRGGKIFVQSRLKQHAGFRQALALAHHLQVHTAQGRAAIAGHIARRIQTRRLVACRLHQHQPNQGLGSVQQNVGLRQIEAVGQREFLLAHPASPPCVMALGGIIGQNC